MTQAVITYVEMIEHPVARVWEALTRPDLFARWWAKGDVRAEEGHRFTLDMGPWGEQPCEVLAVEPGRMIRYSFAEVMTLTWTIEAVGERTRLVFEHAGFDLATQLGAQAFKGMGSGWPAILPRIQDVLAETRMPEEAAAHGA